MEHKKEAFTTNIVQKINLYADHIKAIFEPIYKKQSQLFLSEDIRYKLHHNH